MPDPALESAASPVIEAENTQSPPAQSTISTRRLVRFVGIVASTLLFANGVVCATDATFFDLPSWPLWQLIPALVPIAFIATSILGFRRTGSLLRAAYTFSAAWLGWLNYAFFAALSCWFALGLFMVAGVTVPRPWIGAVFFGLAVLVTLYGLINRAWLRVTRVTVALPKLPKAWVGRTAALVTDLHLGHISGPPFVRRVTRRLRFLQPDIVFISGDMFDGTPVELDRLAAPWADYTAPRGIYFVAGNHDEFAERSLYLNAVARTGIRVLKNEKVTVEGLQIVGVHDSEVGDAVELRRILRAAQIDPDRPSILLAHRPENLPIAEEAGISLQLSGHTHRGQLWPWSLLVGRIYGKFAYGLQRLRKLQVYTSSGAGTWGPPLRIGTKSEIVLIRFVAADSSLSQR